MFQFSRPLNTFELKIIVKIMDSDTPKMNSDFDTFLSVINDFNSTIGSHSEEDINAAFEKIKNLDYTSFTIEQITLFKKETWLPDDFVVKIMKNWMRSQDQLLLEIRAYLVLHPSLPSHRVMEIAKAIQNPSIQIDLTVENIIYTLATTGGSREFVNPYTQRIINVTHSCSSVPNIEHSIPKLFDNNKETFFLSPALVNFSIIISLPPFLNASLTSYKMQSHLDGGPSNWTLEGLETPDDNSNAVLLDQQINNQDFIESYSEKVFPIEQKPYKQYFRHFKLKNTGINHQANNALKLSGFDFSGTIIIAS